jgi:hypothetical protein
MTRTSENTARHNKGDCKDRVACVCALDHSPPKGEKNGRVYVQSGSVYLSRPGILLGPGTGESFRATAFGDESAFLCTARRAA